MRLRTIAREIYTCLNNMIPTYISDIVNIKNRNYNLRRYYIEFYIDQN